MEKNELQITLESAEHVVRMLKRLKGMQGPEQGLVGESRRGSETGPAEAAKPGDRPGMTCSPCFIWWAVISPHGEPWPVGISPNKTCAIRRFLGMPTNTPPGSGRAEEQRRRWGKAKRKGFWLTRIKISQANADG